KTPGRFCFDVARSHAQFDIAQTPGNYPNFVSVNRMHDLDDMNDELDCQRLEIQFHPKEDNSPRAVRDDRSLELEIDSAHATGEEVIIKSDSEVMEARGNDFFYDARTRTSTLKGDPEMYALKEGNEIHARELWLLDQKDAQEATALGAGWIDLLDKPTGKRFQHARWKDRLVYKRDRGCDLLVLNQDASFSDDEHGQQLEADVLKLWLEPSGKAKEVTAVGPGAADNPSQGRRPHRLEASGHVRARSPDLIIRDSDR